MNVIANTLSEAKEPQAFIIMMAMFLLLGWFIGVIFRKLPLFRWLMLGAFLYTVVQNPHLPIAWEFPAFYIFWGFIGAYLKYWKSTSSYSGGFGLSFPSLPRFHGGGAVSTIVGGTAKASGWTLKKGAVLLVWTLKRLIDLPVVGSVFFLRFFFGLKRFIINLSSPKGRSILLTGLREWLWYLVPWEIRAEWERQKSGAKSHTPFGDAGAKESARRYHKEKARAEKKKDWEDRSTFNKINKGWRAAFGKDGAFSGGSSQGEQQSEQRSQRQDSQSQSHQNSSQQSSTHSQQTGSQSSSSSSQESDYWKETREQTERDKAQRNRNEQQSSGSQQQSQQSSSGASSQQSRSSSTGSQSSSQSGSSSQTKTPPKSDPGVGRSRAQDPSLSQEEKYLLSKEYYDQHAAMFQKADWAYDVWETQLDPRGDPYRILGVSSSDKGAVIKKAYFKLSKKYRAYTSDIYPDEVSKRGELIGRILSAAHNRIINR